ncbi:hypothetical protein NC653_012070 [Populus alba x Populus x berolinensis]|uniref:Uncharacterized protein n=1 Tax=Populus alba x Populus x berolinensis TaxID=444605 RepID=A0AAD6R3V7_9ROSI|nr:hypothetical protein NC653_012070 [Populus alba x Populus x berolinensis]
MRVWVISESFVVGLLLICWTHWILKWRHSKCNAVLPPGSIGETLQYLFCLRYSLDVHSFSKKQIPMVTCTQFFHAGLVLFLG